MYIFDNVVDMDFSSMYPHIIIAFNIAPNCMIGKLMINTDIQTLINNLNNYDDEKYDAGKDFVDNMLVKNHSMMGSKWFNLPNTAELDEMIRKEFNIRKKVSEKIDEHYGKQCFVEELII
jgi:hypothetical protein